MSKWRSSTELRRVFRYYQAGIVNTLFGYGIYSILLACGIEMYLAQILSTIVGALFNYITYSRYAFSDQSGSKFRFFISYGANYLLSLCVLFMVAKVIHSPYAAGLVTVVVVSVLNYFVLRNLVFRSERA